MSQYEGKNIILEKIRARAMLQWEQRNYSLDDIKAKYDQWLANWNDACNYVKLEFELQELHESAKNVDVYIQANH
jgi:hypothetical protein